MESKRTQWFALAAAAGPARLLHNYRVFSCKSRHRHSYWRCAQSSAAATGYVFLLSGTFDPLQIAVLIVSRLTLRNCLKFT